MAWAKKILRVNLTKGTTTAEPLNMEWAAQYLGQRGLATKYLVEEIDPKCQPLGSKNKIIFATGPLTGTNAATSGRYSVITKGALTGAIACSNSGGFFGAELKFAGWDMIIVEGKSKSPVYLFVEDEEAKLLPASGLWGTSIWQTQETIQKKHQDAQIRVAAVGRSAEQGCLFACVINDLHRAAGRSGVGTVMASKNLKAIAVRGTKGVGNIKDPKRFLKVVAEHKKVLADSEVTGEGLAALGTQVMMNAINEAGALPSRNMIDSQFDGAGKISGEAMLEVRPGDGKANLTTNSACFGCTIACGRVSTIDKNHFSVANKPEYWHNSGGLEYENAWALGADTGVDDLDALTYANFICNEDGMDAISLGATLAAAMELYEAGVITNEDTGGLELKFGSAEALVSAVELTARGEGFGKVLGLGSKRLCKKYKRPELSMTVKGQEFPAYDPRALQGMAVSYATSNRGACHLRGYTVASEVLGNPVKTDPLITDEKAGLAKAFQDATAAVDSSGLCLFTTFVWSLDNFAPQIDAACEGKWTVERLAETGERIWNLERGFNLAAGLTGDDDNLPQRLLKDAVRSGPAKGKVSELGEMLPEYYKIRGWNSKGVPTRATRKRLGL